MTAHELKEYICTENKIELILEDIGCHSIQFHPDKDYWTAAQLDGDNPLGVVIKNNLYLNYYSYSRNIHLEDGKDIFALVQETKKITFAEVMKYIHNLLGLKYTFKKDKPKEDIPKYDPLAIFKKAASKKKYKNVLDCTFDVLDESVLTDLVPMIHIDIFREGITPKTIKKFGLCYSYRWRRTVFPIRWWLNGELLAYNARTSIENYSEFGITKYWLTPGYQKQNNLYGLWENYKDIEAAKYITILESEKNVCKRDSRLDSTCVALQGHSISDEQVRIILGMNIQEIVIAMDNDVPIEEIRHICEKFYHLRKVSYIYDRWGLLKQNKMSPADSCNKVYDFLFRHRVVYNEREHQLYLKNLGKK
jgi:DNA primase